MKRLRIFLIGLTLLQPAPLTAVSLETLKNQSLTLLKEGAPGALVSAALWRIAYDVPHNWPDVSEPTASFIKTTWKEQGFLQADAVLLKQIPADSFMAKAVVYTQELPGALAVGLPFIRRVEKLLQQKEEIAQQLRHATLSNKQQLLKEELSALEDELDECRFVCGHERVHQERGHAYKILITQCIASFVVYSALQQTGKLLRYYDVCPWLALFLEWKITCPWFTRLEWTPSQSAAEIGIFWFAAHLYEREADVHASTDPKVIEAGIRLFKKAQKQKVPEMGPVGYRTKMMSWVLKYTHPVLSERIWYLTTALKKLRQS